MTYVTPKMSRDGETKLTDNEKNVKRTSEKILDSGTGHVSHDEKKLETMLANDDADDDDDFEIDWKYKDGWDEDKWQQEFDSHPFFMTKAPDPADDLHPLLEGLQQLKYGEEDNTAEDLATTYKKDGLLSFQKCKYRDAILNFTAALKYHCSDELKCQLFNNRAASHFFLANYKSSLQDCREAIKLNPNYTKAKLRIPHCLFHLGNYGECIHYCEEILKEDKDNAKILQLRNDAEEKKKLQERDYRKLQKKLRDEKKLLDAVKSRNIRIKIEGEDLNSVAQLEPPGVPPGLQRVRLQENSLIWSVIIAFPEPKMFEGIRSFHEDITFSEILEDIFEEIHADWDTKKQYTENTINIYFKDEHNLAFKIPITSTLLEAQQHPRYFQDTGIPSFTILVSGSASEKKFLRDCLRTKK